MIYLKLLSNNSEQYITLFLWVNTEHQNQYANFKKYYRISTVMISHRILKYYTIIQTHYN